MFGFIKKLFGFQAVETKIEECPYKVEAPQAQEVEVAPTPVAETKPAPKKKAPAKKPAAAPKTGAPKRGRKPKAK